MSDRQARSSTDTDTDKRDFRDRNGDRDSDDVEHGPISLHPTDSGAPEASTSTSCAPSSPPPSKPPPSLPSSKSNTRPTSTKSLADQELIRLALHRSPYFTCLDEEQIEKFVQAATLEEFRPGQVVILEGCQDEREDENENLNDTQDRDPTLRRRISTDAYADTDEYLLQEVEFQDKAAVIQDTNQDSSPVGRESTGVGEADQLPDQHLERQVTRNSQDEHTLSSLVPPAPVSGNKSYVYIIQSGTTDVLYDTMTPASLGPGTLFGEGGFLFGLPHSASIVARSPLKCWVVDYLTFKNEILPSENMKKLFSKYATPNTQNNDNDNENKPSDNLTQWYMTMDAFIQSCLDTASTTSSSSQVVALAVGEESDSERQAAPNNSMGKNLSIANTFEHLMLLSKQQQHTRSFLSTTTAATTNEIRLTDFCLFHLLMARPDPEVDIAFLLMDRHKTGRIALDDFATFIANSAYPYFDLKSEFVLRHFGRTGQRTIRSYQFSHFLVDLQREMGRQAFLYQVTQHQERSKKDIDNWRSSIRPLEEDGFLPPDEFVYVLRTACGWRLPDGVADRLESIYCKGPIQAGESTAIASVIAGTIKGDTPRQVTDYSTRSILGDMKFRELNLGTRYFTYGDFLAFQEVLERLSGIANLIDHACRIKNGPISQDDFKVANRVIGLGGRLSRRQVDIIFQLFDLDRDGFVSAEDAFSVIGLELAYRLEAVAGREGKSTFAPPPMHQKEGVQPGIDADLVTQKGVGDWQGEKPNDYVSQFVHAAEQFALTTVAGGIGILAVYPLDLVKTRMMNQRIGADGTGRMYLHSFHCLSRTVKYEGLFGLYRGLFPPLLAVGPEKAIKFAVNDLLKGLSSHQDHGSLWWLEIVSGGCAGACQLLVTNPLEITKIRMQLQGETARIHLSKGLPMPKQMSFSRVAVDLGVSGLYKGAAACLLRDIPFGAIYFPAYAACKEYLVHREGSTGAASASTLLLSGTMAAIPASLITSPADMIKTRLQVIPRHGEMAYNEIGDCIRKVYAQEGISAFFKGSGFRVARIAPQFGISLLCYEKLCQLVGFKVAVPPTNVPIDPRDYRTAFPTRAIGTKTEDIDNLVRNMGLQPKLPPSLSPRHQQ
jgi:solute carrier family 25 (mitochondrial aspartate/glutamate transporter), member 12/13